MSPRGPRPAGEDARADIVEAARTEFAERGYDGTSLRAVARAAGVDPALVHHYFDGKPGLFAAAMELPVNPRDVVDEILQAPHDRLGESLVRHFLAVWDSAQGRPRMAALLRAAATHDAAATVLREFVVAEIFGRIAEAHPAGSPPRGPEEAQRRAALIGTQMVGVAFLRYVIELPGVADADPDQLVADVAPSIQRYLDR
ncbi:TetR family transcriptional regulator [Arsenicicoccus dermatophilus]|uniref:TetR/AcrR family transcriptional regulator n=1 Tax=Arsenicicoccus dermatophilus TaxID=1076331 RepID=UPI0039176489